MSDALPQAGSPTDPAPVLAPVSAPSTATAPCCDKMDPATANVGAKCSLCQKSMCKNCCRFINGKPSCVECVRRVLAELEAERASTAGLLPAAIGGVVAAILCGAAWTVMVVVTNMEVGYAAVGVGFATGYGVLLGARRKKSVPLQWTAVGCAILGLALGKYFTIAHIITTRIAEANGLSYFDPRMFQIVMALLPKLLSPFDALWVLFALRVAWRIVRPSDVRVTRSFVPA